jgi:hypothetical protein
MQELQKWGIVLHVKFISLSIILGLDLYSNLVCEMLIIDRLGIMG